MTSRNTDPSPGNSRLRALRSLPNHLRRVVSDLVRGAREAEESYRAGEVTETQIETFYGLIGWAGNNARKVLRYGESEIRGREEVDVNGVIESPLPSGSTMDVRELPGYPPCPDGVTVIVDCAGWGDGYYLGTAGPRGLEKFWEPEEFDDEGGS